MAPNKKFLWKPPIWLTEPEPRIIIYQQRPVETYYGKVEVEKIKLWRGNNRTLLDLEHVSKNLKKPINKIKDNEIIDYILKQGVHRVSDLAESIERNAVRIPLTLTYKKELLDGNRRFLACKYLLKRKKEISPNFSIVPAYCLQPKLSKDLKNTILAEMNFLDNLKEPWPRAVRAQFAVDRYKVLKKQFGEQSALERITFELKLNKNDIIRFKEVLSIIREYQKYAVKESEKTKDDIETFSRENFHFFEEFYNKYILKEEKDLNKKYFSENKKLFFFFIDKDRLDSITSIREFASFLQYAPTRKILLNKGTLEEAKLRYDNSVLPVKLAKKISRFCDWLEGLGPKDFKEIPDRLKERFIRTITDLEKKLK